MEKFGPLYGYFPNASKTHILTKPEHMDRAREIFQGTGVTISAQGKRYLGGAMGTIFFRQQFVMRKVQEWAEEIEILSDIATTQPHAAYAAFTHGLSSRWNYLIRVIDWEVLSASELLHPFKVHSSTDRSRTTG